MYLIESPYHALLSPFGVDSKRSLTKNLDLLARSFDENVILHLKTLTAASNPPSISLLWLSSAVDFLCETHTDAHKLISDLRIPRSLEDSVTESYLDGSVKILDVCNSISSEIERLKQHRLLINFVLDLFKSTGENCQIITPEKIRQAKDSISNSNFSSRSLKKRRFQIDAEALVRDLASRHAIAPRGKITTVEKLVRRIIHAVGLITVFIIGAVRSALYGSPDLVHVRISSEFAWSDAFNALESAISGELRRQFGRVEEKGMLHEMIVLETRLKRACGVLNDADEMKRCVGEVETAKKTFSERLDGLSDGVNKLFDTVLRTRDGMLESLRMGQTESVPIWEAKAPRK